LGNEADDPTPYKKKHSYSESSNCVSQNGEAQLRWSRHDMVEDETGKVGERK
jgi:hypothetical protein